MTAPKRPRPPRRVWLEGYQRGLRDAAKIADGRALLWDPARARTIRVYEMREDRANEAEYIAAAIRDFARRAYVPEVKRKRRRKR